MLFVKSNTPLTFVPGESKTNWLRLLNVTVPPSVKVPLSPETVIVFRVATEKFSEIDSMWSVYSYEGDYNPVHSHMCKTLTGVCAVTWTKIPESISNVSITEKEDTHNNNGLDGHFSIHYGRTTLMDAETLRPPQESNIVPKVGDIYMFPAWLQHVVYPFNGEGERVSVAANINMWNKNEENK